MTPDTELELLEAELASQRRRLQSGAGWLTFAIGLCLACHSFGGWPLALVVGVPASFTALVLGLSWMLEGGVRTVLSFYELRQLEQLPVARVIHR